MDSSCCEATGGLAASVCVSSRARAINNTAALRSRYSHAAGLAGAGMSAYDQAFESMVPPMIQIREIDHIVLRVVNLEAMVRFYVEVLGCRVERRLDELGLVQLRAGRSLIDLVPVNGPLGRRGGAPPGAQGRNLDHFCLRIDPFDEAAIRAALEAAGVVVGETATRYGAEGLGPSIYIEDPEGNTVELKGPPMPP